MGERIGTLFQQEQDAADQAINDYNQEQQQTKGDTFFRTDPDDTEQKEISAFPQPDAVQTNGQRGKRSDKRVQDNAKGKRNVDLQSSTHHEMHPSLGQVKQK